MLTNTRLRELLHYDPDTGVWLRLVTRSHNARAGDCAGYINKDGYRVIDVDGKKYKASRLAWFYQTGEWPPVLVDHSDLDRSNDRWRNLRLATNSQNVGNTPAHTDNSTGLKGVCRVRDRRKSFAAQIMIKGRKRNLGYFLTAEEAHAEYLRAAKDGFGEFARG